MDRPGQQKRPGHPPQPLNEQHIFQERYFGKAATTLEQVAADENCLIAIGDSEPANTLSIPPLEQAIGKPRRFDPLPEGAADGFAPAAGGLNLRDCARRKPVVGMQKKQYLAAGRASPCILLNGSAAASRNHACPALLRQDWGAIVAAAIRDNDLVGAGQECGPHGTLNMRRFIERGDDDRDLHGVIVAARQVAY